MGGEGGANGKCIANKSNTRSPYRQLCLHYQDPTLTMHLTLTQTIFSAQRTITKVMYETSINPIYTNLKSHLNLILNSSSNLNYASNFNLNGLHNSSY